MMKTLNDWNLSRKLLTAFAAIGVLLVGLGVTGIVTNNRLSVIATQHVEEGINGTEALARVIGYVREHRIIVYSLLNALNAEDAAKLEERFVKNRANLKQAVDDFAPASRGLEPQLALLRTDVAEVEKVNEQIFAAKKTQTFDDVLKIIKTAGKEASQTTIKHTEELIALTHDRSEAANIAGRAAASNALYLISALFVAGIAALFAIWSLMSRTVAQPLAQLSATTRTLAEGGEASVPHRDRGDELGEVAKAVELFRNAAVDRAETDARHAAQQKVVVETVSLHLSDLSEGDLTAEIDATFPPQYAGLKTNFNAALTKLRELIGAVGESAATIRTGSGEIAQASEDLARRTEGNAASLEQTAAAISQMDARLRATTDAARRSAVGSQQAMVAVTDGRNRAEDAVSAMGRVSDSAKGIDSVIEGLDKIAFQTRVLAMNAAVEAGRAGDAGRGFAVVADLVSALAMRAEEEAKAARDQLTVTQADIVAAVDAVGKVDRALADISASGGEATELAARIAADNEAQSSAITQISAAIGTMDQATQQNAAMVEETSAAARNLASEVGSLADQAARFKVGAGVAKPAVAKSVAQSSRQAPARAAFATADDWTSF